MENQDDSHENDSIPDDTDYVIDGGALLRRVIWRGSTYKEIIRQYLTFVMARYGKCTIVFDGYTLQKTIKDHEHLRRSQRKQTCPDILIHEDL